MKIQVLVQYFKTERSISDRNHGLRLLLGHYPKRVIPVKKLRSWTSELTGFPDWLIDRSQKEIGNFINTLALLMRNSRDGSDEKPLDFWIQGISRLSDCAEDDIKKFISEKVPRTTPEQRLILLKLLTGTFKSPIFPGELIKAVAQVLHEKHEIIALRLHDYKSEKNVTFEDLRKPVLDESKKIPLPFSDIVSIETADSSLGPENDWMAFGKREGLEVQLIKHGNSVNLWTREGEIVSDKFPEIIALGRIIPMNVKIYGYLMPKKRDVPFSLLINQIGKKTITKKELELVKPQFEVWGVLEHENKSDFSLASIKHYFPDQYIVMTSRRINFTTWKELSDFHKNCRDHGFAGISLQQKHKANTYYYLKANVHSIRAILMYVEFGVQTKSGIHSMTFGVFQGNEILPVAKISDFNESINFNEIIAYVKSNTIERFGPVRTVKPSLVFELYFDSVSISRRRKAGLALANAKLNRKIGNNPSIADTLDNLKKLL